MGLSCGDYLPMINVFIYQLPLSYSTCSSCYNSRGFFLCGPAEITWYFSDYGTLV
jgi:hypothetical protein